MYMKIFLLSTETEEMADELVIQALGVAGDLGEEGAAEVKSCSCLCFSILKRVRQTHILWSAIVLIVLNFMLELVDVSLESNSISGLKKEIDNLASMNGSHLCNESLVTDTMPNSTLILVESLKTELNFWADTNSGFTWLMFFSALIAFLRISYLLVSHRRHTQGHQRSSHSDSSNVESKEMIELHVTGQNGSGEQQNADESASFVDVRSLPDNSSENLRCCTPSHDSIIPTIATLYRRVKDWCLSNAPILICIELVGESTFVLLVCCGQLKFARASPLSLCLYKMSATSSAQAIFLLLTALVAFFLCCRHIYSLSFASFSILKQVFLGVFCGIDFILSIATVYAALIVVGVAHDFDFLVRDINPFYEILVGCCTSLVIIGFLVIARKLAACSE